MKNFQCYYGEHEDNIFKFKEGLNIVIGENGSGKSKLFDAFYWVLNDKYFSSDTREFVLTRTHKEKLISDKAKHECKIGDSVSVEIILIAITAVDTKYRITRIYSAKKIDEIAWECDADSKLIIDEYKTYKWTSVPSSKHESILRRVISVQLRPYMWFQGEQVDKLMDFRDKSTLTKAINTLSNIEIYDDLIDIAKQGFEKAQKAYRTEQNKLIKDKDKSKNLNSDLESVLFKIKNMEKGIEENEGNFELAKNKIDELIGQIDDATRKAELKKKKENIDREIIQDDDRLNKKYNGLHKKMFNESWVLRNSTPIFDKFSKKYNDYFQSHLSIVNSVKSKIIELPIDIPQPIHVNQMLKHEKCFVCGRDAKKGTDEYNHIDGLLGRADDKEEPDLFKHDCSPFFSKLYDNGLGFKQLIKNIDKNITGEMNEIQTLRNSLRTNKAKSKTIENSFEEMLADDKSENIVKAYRTHETNREKYQSLLTSDSKVLEGLIASKNRLNSGLEELVTGNVDKFAKKSHEIFEALFKISESTKDSVFNELIAELENTANELFNRMTEKNNAITGDIKLKRLSNGNYVPEIVDREGHILSQLNDSNIILVKLSLIMSIIISRGKGGENFSLISDAPTSKMAENYSYGFYQTLSKEFTQSIVMTYDFNTEEKRKVLKEYKTGSIYVIKSIFPNNDSSDRTDLSTEIKEIMI